MYEFGFLEIQYLDVPGLLVQCQITVQVRLEQGGIWVSVVWPAALVLPVNLYFFRCGALADPICVLIGNVADAMVEYHFAGSLVVGGSCALSSPA